MDTQLLNLIVRTSCHISGSVNCRALG